MTDNADRISSKFQSDDESAAASIVVNPGPSTCRPTPETQLISHTCIVINCANGDDEYNSDQGGNKSDPLEERNTVAKIEIPCESGSEQRENQIKEWPVSNYNYTLRSLCVLNRESFCITVRAIQIDCNGITVEYIRQNAP